ncbi:alpha/beta hydrolase [Candidatus Saccharibacteria bacterium]|nr:alpha/beta hydrolase [Candidatus Saccharibacteria bacterium]
MSKGKSSEAGPKARLCRPSAEKTVGCLGTLYIVHGWTTTLDGWQATIAELDRLGVKAHLLKVPGLTTGPDQAYTITDYVNWAAKTIPPGAIVLGHSNGGRILLNAIAAGKLKPQKLILLSSAGIYYRSSRSRVSKLLSKYFGWLKHLPGLRRLVHRFLGASDYAKASPAMKKTLENMLESDKHLDPAKVQVPTQILWGGEDRATPLWMGQRLAREIPNAQLEIIPNWPHSPYRKPGGPQELAAKIAEQL